jgi:hypothetical protein
MTCKHIRVGRRWQDNGSGGSGSGGGGRHLLTHPVMNPYKQARNCRCFNIREYVRMDMFENPQRALPEHLLAPYPFSVGIVSKVSGGVRCGPTVKGLPSKPGGKPSLPCGFPRHQLRDSSASAGPPPQACIQGASGKTSCSNRNFVTSGSADITCDAGGVLNVNFTSAKGVSLTGAKTVIASCDNSAFTSPSSCDITSKTATVRAAGPGAVVVNSPEWDSNCVCKNTGRRPTMIVNVPEVIVGSICTGP